MKSNKYHCRNSSKIQNKNVVLTICGLVQWWDRRGHHRMIIGFTTTCAISAYHHKSCEFKQGVLDTKLCDKVCQ